jgi:hypothetical protein
MLANAVICLALIAFAANTILSAGLAAARTSVLRLAQTYVNQGSQRAIDALQSGIAAYAQSTGLQGPLPAFTPLPEHCAQAQMPCAFTTSATVSLVRSDIATTPSPCDAASPCANNEQANPHVFERRISARISVAVRAADGSVLATRELDVTLRAMTVSPYAAIVGTRDRSVDAIAAEEPAGEDAGRPAATANPCAIASAGVADDTVVRVAYENAATGACSDGSSWRTTAY